VKTSTGEEDDQNDDDENTETAGRVITPMGAIGPNRKRADQQKDEQNNQDQPHFDTPLEFKRWLRELTASDEFFVPGMTHARISHEVQALTSSPG
jgi:hypothetical protein